MGLLGSKWFGVGVGGNVKGLGKRSWRFGAGFVVALVVLVRLLYQSCCLMQHIHFLFILLFVLLTSLVLQQITRTWLEHLPVLPLIVLRKSILFIAISPHLFLLMSISEDVLKFLENDASNNNNLLCIDKFPY